MTEEKLLYTAEMLKEFNFDLDREHDFSPAAFKKRFGASRFEIVYFLEPDSYLVTYSGYSSDHVYPGEIRDRLGAALNLAVTKGGLFFTGIHSESDWSRTKWWGLGQHIVNRSGEYAVVIFKRRMLHPVTKTKTSKRARARKSGTRGASGLRGLR